MAGHDGQESRASSQAAKARPANRRVAQWARDYVRLPGIPDEYIAQDGAPRPVWTRFFDAFAGLTPGEIERRFGAADRHLREAGVTYRAPGENADRLWPLSHLPLLIDDAEWQQLTAGIVQRAQLLELVLSDLYGEGHLVAEGAVPAAAIAGSTEYLRSVCGIKPPGGRYLNLYAADVGRVEIEIAAARRLDAADRAQIFGAAGDRGGRYRALGNEAALAIEVAEYQFQ